MSMSHLQSRKKAVVTIYVEQKEAIVEGAEE
jgi:hypothetical protein